MRRVRKNLCRTSKGRFTKCRGRSRGLSGLGRTRGRRCSKGVVKSGPRKGMCKKHR